jgi:serine-type D-Ala-D-Ala carboxypeptidase/endopeptidase (penicillin-binding protein 4)
MRSYSHRALALFLACTTACAVATRSGRTRAAERTGDGPQTDVRVPQSEQSRTGIRSGRSALEARIQAVLHRPEFRSARWGMKFYSPDTKEVIYSLNSDQLFNPASSMKVFTTGTAFTALGADYRFHTPVYRTGPVEDGVLKGDLVLVASGDLLLGGRVQRDGTLALPERDHTYDMSTEAVPVSADPLRSVTEIAQQIAAQGIRRVEGRVLVDGSLFREGKGEAGGTGEVVISPMMINDNLVDVMVGPGSRAGEAGRLRVSPETTYVRIINKTRTTTAARPALGGMRPMGPGALRLIDDVTNADGSHTVTLTGDVPLGSRPVLCAYRVPEPVRFAQMLLAEALRAKGVSARADLLAQPDYGALAASYRPENRVAELVSPPLFDEVKPMLKLSSNPHTLEFPYLVGAIAGHDKENARKAGRELQKKLFEKAGVSRAHLGGGELGTDRYSADAFISFLTYMSQQPWFSQYRQALPILGKDGTVAKVLAGSPAAGHVYAKTGTALWMVSTSEKAEAPKAGGPAGRRLVMADSPTNGVNIVKALAGYIELPDGRFVVFAEFLEQNGLSTFRGFDPFDQVMGELVGLVYDSLAARSR